VTHGPLRFAAALLAAAFVFPAWADAPARASLFVVLVLDGLRPDSINATDMPNLHRLRGEGVTFLNSHSVFPTVTRVNGTAIGTGDYPARNGIMGNRIYVPEVDPVSAFSNDDAAKLLVMGDHIVTAPSLAEILQRAGERFVEVSSGSAGGALLVAPRSPEGMGLSLSAGFQSLPQSGKLKDAIDEVARRFGPAPHKGGAMEGHEESVTWAMRVFDDYVLAELKPRVALSWMTEPDHSQHAYGPGSPQALTAIRNDDAEIGKLLAKLQSLGLAERTDILVVSDHGFSHTVGEVNVARAFKDAGFKLSEDGGDVVIASSGQAIGVHVKGRDAPTIASIAKFLQSQPWCGLVFTAHGDGKPFEGRAPGTFSLEYAHLGGHERSPDIVFTFPWTSERNRFGVRGGDWSLVGKGGTGPVTTDRANHGGIGPWTVTNTMLAWGPDFKRGVVVRTPAANVDVAPTILHLLGMRPAAAAMDGRALVEAMAGGPDEEQVPIETRTLRVSNGSYRAVLQVTEVEGRRYIDKGWRE
jgi:arylsulfatase A-like enzyme